MGLHLRAHLVLALPRQTQNFVRPFRFALAVALAPLFDRAITWVAAALRMPKGGGLVVLLLLQALANFAIAATILSVLGGFPEGIPSLESLPFFKQQPAA